MNKGFVQYRGAGTLIVADNTGRVLLLDRADGKGWSHPGGFCEGAEPPAHAAARELREETGFRGPVTVTRPPLEILVAHDGEHELLAPGSPRPWWYAFEYTVFVVSVPEEFVPVLNEEHVGATWADPDDIGPHLHPGAALCLAYLRRFPNEYV